MSNDVATINNASGALAELGLGGGISLDKKTTEESTGIKAGSYFPFLTLLQPLSNATEEFGAGSFILKQGGKDDKPLNLGSAFDAFVIAVRGKAIKFDQNSATSEYHTSFKKTDNYDAFVAAAEDRSQDNPYKKGLEVLMWVPSEERFITYFAMSYTAITAVQENVMQFCANGETFGTSVVFSSVLKKSAKGKFYIPTCSPVAEADYIEWVQPSQADMLDAIKRFVDPDISKQAAEGAEKAEGPARSR